MDDDAEVIEAGRKNHRFSIFNRFRNVKEYCRKLASGASPFAETVKFAIGPFTVRCRSQCWTGHPFCYMLASNMGQPIPTRCNCIFSIERRGDITGKLRTVFFGGAGVGPMPSAGRPKAQPEEADVEMLFGDATGISSSTHTLAILASEPLRDMHVFCSACDRPGCSPEKISCPYRSLPRIDHPDAAMGDTASRMQGTIPVRRLGPSASGTEKFKMEGIPLSLGYATMKDNNCHIGSLRQVLPFGCIAHLSNIRSVLRDHFSSGGGSNEGSSS